MRMIEGFNRIVNIAATLGRKGYTEGSYTDLYVQRLLKIYSRPQNGTLEEDHSQGEINGDLTINEPANTGYAAMDIKVSSLVG